jgi:hypothetical protein
MLIRMGEDALEREAEPTLHSVMRTVGAVLIGWAWVRLVFFVGLLVWVVVAGTLLGRAVGAVLLLGIAVWIWRGFRAR